MIFNKLSEILGRKLDPNSFSAIFAESPSFSLSQKNVITITTLLARRLIPMKWKSPAPLSHTHWIQDVLYFLKLEKTSFSKEGPMHLSRSGVHFPSTSRIITFQPNKLIVMGKGVTMCVFISYFFVLFQ